VVRQPLGGLFEVHQPVCVLRAAAPASAAAQPLCETKPLRTPLSTATAISPPEATPAGAALNLWDSSGVRARFRDGETGSPDEKLGSEPFEPFDSVWACRDRLEGTRPNRKHKTESKTRGRIEDTDSSRYRIEA